MTNGTLDLRTGELRSHDPRDLITKIAGCEYDHAAPGPSFDRFIGEVLPKADVRGFVQRMTGLSLLGRVEEHVLPIFTGVGGNGKTTLVELLLKVFGDYGIMAEPELLVEHTYSHIRPDRPTSSGFGSPSPWRPTKAAGLQLNGQAADRGRQDPRSPDAPGLLRIRAQSHRDHGHQPQAAGIR